MSRELNLKIAKLALTKHYDEDEAANRVEQIQERIRGMAKDTNPEVLEDPKFEDLLSQDAVALSINMMWEPEPWWDSEDSTELAINQLERESLFVSVDSLVSSVEEALGRELEGETQNEKWTNLGNNRFQILAELKGEEYQATPQDMLGQLLEMIQGQGGELPEDDQEPLDGTPTYDDFGAPTE